MKREKKGITLIALVVTIVVLLILAGVSITLLTGENGIITQAKDAKEQTEISEEKEILEISVIQSMQQGKITKTNLSEKLNANTGDGKTKVYKHDDGYAVIFTEKDRVYIVDDDGNVEQGESSIIKQDKTPGEFDGSGIEGDPYIINSIEDLVQLSQDTSKGNNYSGIYVKLGRDLNFLSELSYCNAETKEYNEFLGITNDIGLLEALTNTKYEGFYPINNFSGNFDGNGKVLKNIYINKNSNAGVFQAFRGRVENLEVNGTIKGNGWVGGIVGIGATHSMPVIKNCKFQGNIENSSTEATYQGTGGILGGSSTVGGTTIVENCIVKGKITGVNAVGGIIGNKTSGYCKINRCKNEASLIGNDYVGGIVGRNVDIIKNSLNIGTCTSNNMAGGIVAYNCKEIINSYNKGIIIGNQSGGITGRYYFATSSINNSYNAGIVKNSQEIERAGVIHNVFVVSTSLTLNNVFWQENTTQKWIASGAEYVTGEPTMMTKEEMTDESNLLKKLNDYVKNYNEENKNNEDFVGLVEWIQGEDGYPTLDFNS